MFPQTTSSSLPIPTKAAGAADLDATRPSAERRLLLQSMAIWLGLVGFMVLVKILSLTLIPITFRGEGQQGLFTWTTIGVFAVLGLVGIWCAQQTGFPAAWDPRVTTRQRLLFPALLGVALGTAATLLDLLTGGSAALTQVLAQPSFNIDFPGSVLAYSAGAIEMELQYRLFTLPFLLWLISRVLLRGHGERVTLWVLGAIVAGFEPVLQGIGLAVMGGGIITPVMLGAYLLTAIPANAAEVIMFRKYGFLAPITLRLGQYAIWHILYGNFLYGAVNPRARASRCPVRKASSLAININESRCLRRNVAAAGFSPG